MKKLFTLILLVGFYTGGQAATQTVMVRNNEFSPQAFTVNAGDTVRFVWEEGIHTTTSTSVPSGALSWMHVMDQNPGNTSFIYVASEYGTYNYQCDYHQAMGMTGQFTVIDPLGIKTTLAENVKIKSNRVADFLIIEITGEKYFTPLIRDITGQAVKRSEPVRSGLTNLYVGDLTNGIYILELSNGIANKNFRFIKSGS